MEISGRGHCPGCPYKMYPCIPPSPIPAEGASLAIVGEAPGSMEIGKKRPFVGPSGQLIDQTLKACDVPADTSIFKTNALLCRPPQGKPIKREAIEACRGRVLRELKEVDPQVVLAFGNSALHSLTGDHKLKISVEQGGVLTDTLVPDKTVVASYHPAAILRSPGMYKAFKSAVGKASSLLKGQQLRDPGQTEYWVARTEEDVVAAAELLKSYTHMSFDIETTGLNPRKDRILVIGISYAKNKSIVFANSALPFMYHIFDLEVLQIYQNGKFDTAFTRRRGWNSTVHEDTLLQHYTLNETKGTHDLEQLAIQNLGAKAYKAKANVHIKSKGGLAAAAEEITFERVAVDADYTLQLFHIFAPMIAADGNLTRLYYNVLIPASEFLRKVERTGIYVDLEALDVLHEELTAKVNGKLFELREMVKGLWDPHHYVAVTDAKQTPKIFKPTSWRHISYILYDRLQLKPAKGKKRSTSKEVIKDFEDVCAIIKPLLELRGYVKMLRTYVVGIKKRLGADGRIHTTYLLHGTETGRLSSRNPNVQNIPKGNKTVRNVFRAAPGKILVEADYKAAELHWMAHYSGDVKLKQVFIDGRDLHDETSTELFGPGWGHEERMKAKTVNFGIPYGRKAPSIAMAFGISTEEAQDLIDRWFAAYQGAAAYFLQCERDVMAGRPLVTLFGNMRRFGLITKDNVDALMNEGKNFRIQATSSHATLMAGMSMQGEFQQRVAAGIATKLLADIAEALPSNLQPHGAKVINLVHDSILVECDDTPQAIEGTIEVMKAHMVALPHRVSGTNVPFAVDVGVGYRWGDIKPYKAAVDPKDAEPERSVQEDIQEIVQLLADDPEADAEGEGEEDSE